MVNTWNIFNGIILIFLKSNIIKILFKGTRDIFKYIYFTDF